LQPLGLLGAGRLHLLVFRLEPDHAPHDHDEKIARRGVRVPVEYTADVLDRLPSGSDEPALVSLKSEDTIAARASG